MKRLKLDVVAFVKKKSVFINCLCIETFLNELFKNVLEFKKKTANKTSHSWPILKLIGNFSSPMT